MSIDKTYVDYETYKKEVAEVERLKEILQKPKIDEFSYNKIQQENKQLREALDNCSPYTIYNDFDNDYQCFFCASYDDEPHEEDCLYYMATDLHYQSMEEKE